MIKTPKIIIATIILFILVENIFSQKNNLSEIQKSTEVIPFVPKKAGIAFRIDDNPTKEYYSTMAQLFDHYNNNTFGRSYHFSFALNFGAKNFDTLVYRDTIKAIQSRGHEIMDHTPNHRTNYFVTKFDSVSYINPTTQKPIDGVHHVKKVTDSTYKVCLEFNPPTLNGGVNIGACSVSGNTLTGNFSSFIYNDDVYVYLNELDTLVFIQYFNSDKSVAYIQDVWEEPITLPFTANVSFYKMSRANKLSIKGLRVLANETLNLAEFYGFEPPTTWIQPGGRHPILSMAELSEALTPLGYSAGASFGETQSLKVYNEYDPNDIKKFGMQWEDFNEDRTNWTMDGIKKKIAEGIARNKILFGHNHFYDLGKSVFVTPATYFQRVGEILAWCHQNNIEINTYNEWANILYDQTSDPFQNVFPSLNNNFDNYTTEYSQNGVPDGYYPRYWSDHGYWETDSELPQDSNYCFSISAEARVFRIDDISGIEKGENEFEIWTKGQLGDSIIVIFSYNGGVTIIDTFKFPAVTPSWTKYKLNQSTNGNTILNIAETISNLTVEVKCSDYISGIPVKVSGMSLSKKIQTISTNLKIFLEGAYSSPNSMPINPAFQSVIQTSQPFSSSPWNYNGTENVLSIPNGVVDWVLVELRETTEANSIKARKAGFVKTDGTIVGLDGITNLSFDISESNYFVVIYHRNHLPIMSSVPVSFN